MKNAVHILCIGDTVGHAGRIAITEGVPRVRKTLPIDLVIANAENASGGFGLTEKTYHELRSCGVDVLTMGNHTWDKREIFNFIDNADRIIRPANYPPGTPGRGWTIVEVAGIKVAVVSLLGRTFLNIGDCPFQVLDRELKKIKSEAKIVIVDFHAEASSDKMTLAHYIDGQISALVGTHTHVQTADEQIFPRGTGYITDIGMSGPQNSVLGMKPEQAIRRVRDQLPVRFEVADGPPIFCAVWLAIDKDTGRTLQIQRINYR